MIGVGSMKSGHIEYSEQTYMGKTDYVLTAYCNNEEVFKENFVTREEALRVKDVICDYLYYFDLGDDNEPLDIVSLSAFVRNVCCYYIPEAEQIIKSRPCSSTYLVNPIKVNYIKKDRDWYASVSVNVKYTTSRGLSSERYSEIKIFSKDDKDKAVKDIIRMFYKAVRLVHNDLINYINGDLW